MTAKDIEEDEVIEPGGVLSAVDLEGLPFGRCVLGEETAGGLGKQRHFGVANLLEVDAGGMCACCGDVLGKLVRGEPAPGDSTSSEMSSGLPAKAEMEE